MADDTDNGRVTLAVLKNEMQHTRDDIAELRQELKYLSTQIVQIGNDQLKRINELERRDSAKDERWESHKGEHARESANQKWFSSIFSAVLSTISAIVGALVKSP